MHSGSLYLLLDDHKSYCILKKDFNSESVHELLLVILLHWGSFLTDQSTHSPPFPPETRPISIRLPLALHFLLFGLALSFLSLLKIVDQQREETLIKRQKEVNVIGLLGPYLCLANILPCKLYIINCILICLASTYSITNIGSFSGVGHVCIVFRCLV